MTDNTKKLAAGIVLFGLGGFVFPLVIVGAVVFYLMNEKPLAQFVIPAQIEVSIDKQGRYYVWNDYQTTFEGKTYVSSSGLPDNLAISLREKQTQTPLTFNSDLSIFLGFGKSLRSSIGYFEIVKPGVYSLEVSGETFPRVFSFGQFFLNLKKIAAIVIAGFVSVAIALWGFILALIGVVGLFKSKGRSGQELLTESRGG